MVFNNSLSLSHCLSHWIWWCISEGHVLSWSRWPLSNRWTWALISTLSSFTSQRRPWRLIYLFVSLFFLQCILCLLLKIWNLFASNDSINYPFEAFTTLDHMDNKFSLIISLMSYKMLFKLFPATADSEQNLTIGKLDSKFLMSNKIKIIFDVYYWNTDAQFFNKVTNLMI